MRRVFLILCVLRAVSATCTCAPLASCIVFPNGTRGCHCPFFGDGVTSCTEQRFVTHATVRSRQDGDLQSWLGHLGRTPTAVSWRKLLSSQTAIVELDSTDYDAMVELTRDINARSWPYEVALLGTAMRMEQMARIAEGRARGFKTSRMAQRGQGPFEIALDDSGSMDFVHHGFGVGQKWSMARAFACAAALYAADNKRKVGLTLFNGDAKSVPCDLSGKRGRVDFIKAVLGLRVSGGTEFDPLLKHLAAKKLAAGADILLVSDGNGSITPSLAKEYFKTRDLAYIVIGDPSDSNETLTECADGRMAVGKDLFNDPKAIAVAAEALRPK